MKKKSNRICLEQKPLPTLPGDVEGTHKLEQLLLHLGLAERRAHPHFPTRILKREKQNNIKIFQGCSVAQLLVRWLLKGRPEFESRLGTPWRSAHRADSCEYIEKGLSECL
jgi:hypothetical protein